jgi:DnaJ-class molecular chaperone
MDTLQSDAQKCPQCLGTGHRTRMGCYGPIVSMVWPCEVCRGTGLPLKPKMIETSIPLPYEPERGNL